MTITPQDDQVLAQLYKEGAKNTPPAKLNYEIISYAANANQNIPNHEQVCSHFGGAWKVPLSMAASIVVVFSLLVQLDQSSQQLELPPIPDISILIEQKPRQPQDNVLKSQPATEDINEAEKSLANNISSFKNDAKESDKNSQGTGALIIDNQMQTEPQTATHSIQTKRSANKNAEQKIEASRDRSVLKKSIPSDEFRSQNNEPTKSHSTSSPNIPKSKPNERFSTKTDKSQAVGKQIHEPSKDVLSNSAKTAPSDDMQPRSMSEKPVTQEREDTFTASDMAADTEIESDEAQTQSKTENEQRFAPIPVEDWLLMIELLIARKDYAEAARQLVKFKQAHPKINVDDLDAKIP